MGKSLSKEQSDTLADKMMASIPDDKVSIDAVHDALDAFDVPRFAPNTGDTLSLAGRVGVTMDRITKLETQVQELNAAPRSEPAGERLNTAKALLHRSVKFLAGFDATASLRQDIKLFLGDK